MSVINATPLLAAAGGDYQISRSVRLRSSASAFFNRTPASAGNRKTWTWSGWVKRGQLGQNHGLLAATTGTPISFGFHSSDQFFITVSGVGVGTTTAVFRDPSAWYHVVIAFDTTQGPTADRVNIYINNVRYALSNTLVSLNTDYEINNNTAQQMGTTGVSGSTTYFDGYLTEIHFINGAVLNPSSFGETDSITGVWKPKKYAGTYGTNGFYLNFSDNSSNTATTIGKDYSGNGNNWTPNNISVTAGVTYDSMIDVPTLYADGGNGRGNYAVLNPIFNPNGTVVTYSAANLQYSYSTPTGVANKASASSSIGVSTGKWYFEFTEGSPANSQVGISSGLVTGGVANGTNYVFYYSGSWNVSSATTPAAPASFTTNDVIGVAFDVDNRTAQFFKNGVSQGTITAFEAGLTWFPFTAVNTSASGGAGTFNFGQRPFAYTPPTGFKALNTQNLP